MSPHVFICFLILHIRKISPKLTFFLGISILPEAFYDYQIKYKLFDNWIDMQVINNIHTWLSLIAS